MGYARLYFARDPKGGLTRISVKDYDAFHFRTGALPPALADADGMVNVAALHFETEHRALVRLVNVSFSRLGVLKDGRSDPAHEAVHFRSAAHRMDEAHRASASPSSPDAVIDAAHRFEGKRLDALTRWTPTEGELELLRSAVGHRLDLGDSTRDQREKDLAGRPTQERLALATESGLEWQMRVLVRDPEPAVRAAAAANRYVLAEVLDGLRKDSDLGVLAALAANYHSSPEWLARMAKHESALVRAAVAGNVRTPDPLVARMAWADSDPEVRRSAREHIEQKLGAAVQQASSPYVGEWYLAYAARDSRVEVRLAAATNPRLSEKLLPLLARDADPLVKQAIAARLGIEGDPARLFPEPPAKVRERGARQRRLPKIK